MSPECVDLLNRIFQINEGKRIKIEEIRQHPWYVEPLSPRYEQAMHDILAQQAQIDAQLRLATVRPPASSPPPAAGICTGAPAHVLWHGSRHKHTAEVSLCGFTPTGRVFESVRVESVRCRSAASQASRTRSGPSSPRHA